MHGFAVDECVVYLAIIKYVHDAWAHMGKEEGDATYLSSAAANQQAMLRAGRVPPARWTQWCLPAPAVGRLA
jgi:hypothetical protein